MSVDGEKVQVLGPDGPDVPVVETGGRARALVWPGVGAQFRSMHLIELDPGGRTRPQVHDAEAVYYVVTGGGSVGAEDLEEGSMIHVAAGGQYVLEAGAEGMQVVGGPSPPDASLYENRDPESAGGAVHEAGGGTIRTFHRDRPGVMVPMIASDARLVVWLGVGARDANMNYVNMQPGEENVPHAHPESEDTIYIVSGRGTVEDLTNGVSLEFEAGQAIQVPPGVQHRVKADRGSAVVSVGGPCPADERMLRAAGVHPDDSPAGKTSP
jgi:quercetin dioxygenase-like cupin family protein